MCFYQRSWFADEIVQFTGYGGELMRDAIRNDDYVTFGYLMCLPAFNFGAADFVRRDLLRIDCLSTCDERGRAIDDINDISIQRVDLRLARLDSPAGVHFVTGGFEPRPSFCECCSDVAGVYQDCIVCRFHHRRATHL